MYIFILTWVVLCAVILGYLWIKQCLELVLSVAVNGTHIQGAAPSYQLAPICSVVTLADSHERAAFIQVRTAVSNTKAHSVVPRTIPFIITQIKSFLHPFQSAVQCYGAVSFSALLWIMYACKHSKIIILMLYRDWIQSCPYFAFVSHAKWCRLFWKW